MSQARHLRHLATLLLLVAAAATALAAENSTDSENSLVPNRSPAGQRRSIVQRLLTWPEEAKEDDDKGDHEEAKEEEPLESDRPDFTDSSTTVGYHRLQIESGYTFTHAIAGDPTHDAHDLPELLVRYGLAERLELRVGWDNGVVFDRQRSPASGRVLTETGVTDMEWGFKYAITKQDHWQPQSAVIVSNSVPVGSFTQSSRQVDVLVNYLYSWDLSKKLSLNCSTGSLWTAEQGDHYTRFSQSASIEYELTDKLRIFNEWFAFFRSDFNDNRPQHYYDAGLTYLVTPNFQLDWRAGLGLNDAADGFFTGCGVTIRK